MDKGRHHEDFISAYLRYVDNTEPSELFKKWTAFSLISAALRRKVWLDWQEKIFPNLFTLLVGPPAARKGAAMSPALSFIRELGIPLAADCSTRAALVQDLKGSFSGLETGSNGVVTPHSSLTIFNKELINLLGFQNRELIGDLCQFYDCEPRWKKKTTTQGIFEITNLWLNLIGAITPSLLRQSCPVEIVGGGFISRCCIVFSEKPGKIVQAPTMSKIEGKWTLTGNVFDENNPFRKSVLHDLGMISLLAGQFQLHESWIDEWCGWYNGTNNDIPAFHDTPLEEYIGRRQVHAQKLSLIISAAEGDSMLITGKHLRKGIEFLEEIEEKMLDTFSGFGESTIAAATNKIMRIVGTAGKIHVNEVYKRVYMDLRREDFFESLNSLKAIGFLEQEQDGTLRHIPK